MGYVAAARLTALGELSGRLVHAVNNGLYGILAQLELLEGQELDEETRERLRLIEESGRQLEETVRALGTAVRRAQAEPPAQLDELVRAALELPGLDRVEVSFPPAAVAVAGDPAAVADLVLLLLVNAADAELTADGTLLVTRRASRDDGFTLAVAGALARSLGGELEESPGSLRLSLPLR